MRLSLPWGLIAIFVSFAIFYYTAQKARLRREQRKERLREKREEWMDSMFRKDEKTNHDDNNGADNII